MHVIPNPHTYGSPAWKAIEDRIRLQARCDSIVGVVAKRGYTDQGDYNRAKQSYRRPRRKSQTKRAA